MAPNPLYAHCIRRAAELLGGFDKLGAHLEVSPRHLMNWADGLGAPSDAMFLKIVDIVLDKQQGAPRVPPQLRSKSPGQ